MKYRLLFFALTISIVASAQEKGATPLSPPHGGAGGGASRAVVVGISDYQDQHIPDLKYADRDATAFAAYLQSPAGGSLPQENIRLLTNKAATTGAIASAMDWLIADCQPGDRAIIYFSGHGDVETRTRFQRGFLLTYDSPPSNYLAGAFALIFLQDIISTLADQGVQVVMVSDACRAGKLAGSDIGGAQATAANLSKQFANEIKILSCQPDEFSLEGEQWGGGRGAFSYNLIDGLTGMADQNADKQVNLLEINRYLEEVVPKETAPQTQIPMVVGNKSTVIAEVDEASLEDMKHRKLNELPAISAIDARGVEDAVLAGIDSIWQKKYEQFTAALGKGELLEPAGISAYDLYQDLSQVQGLEKLQGIMKRNLATALQDESQQAINAYLRSDEEELAAQSRGDLKYTKFVRYLEKAAELLGESHYMYKTLKAKQYYFDAVDIRVRFEWRTFSLADSSLIWYKQRVDLIQKALELEESAAFIQFEKGILNDTTTQYFEKAIELAPTWILPYVHITVPLRRAGKFEEALAYAAKAKELAPESSFAYAVAADIHASKGENKKAEELFLKAVQISPRNVFWLKYLSYAYYNQGKLRDAERTWLKILELSPEDNETYNSLSQLYFSKTYEYDKSEAINRKRLEMRPTDGDAYSDLITTYVNSRQPEKTRSLIEEMEKINDSVENWEGQATIGYAYQVLGEHEKAIPYYQKAVKAAPKSTWHYYTFAQLYFDLGEFEKGLACLDTAFANGMDYSWVEQNSGVERAHKSPSYKAFAQRVIDARPQMGFGYRLMAEYFKGKGDIEESVGYCEQAVAKSPDQRLNWINYFQVAYLLGQKEKTDTIVRRYLALYPDDGQFMNSVAMFYKNHGEFESAEPLFKSAIEHSPDALYIRRNFARLYFFYDKKKEAFAVLEEAIKTDPHALTNLGLMAFFSYLNQPQTAKPWFDEIAKINPAYSQLWDCMESIRNDGFDNADTCWQHIASQSYFFWHDMIKYQYLKMKIRQGEKEKAVELFSEILERGWFVNYQLFGTDPGLDPIRSLDGFQKLMREYFPEKAKR